MKILVTGDRNWTDEILIEDALTKACPVDEATILIHGAARGADSIAAKVMQRWIGADKEALKSSQFGPISYDLDEIKEYPADWKKYGRAAGVLRNQQMLDENPDIDLVLAFHDNLAESKGTKDMVERAKKADIPVKHIHH